MGKKWAICFPLWRREKRGGSGGSGAGKTDLVAIKKTLWILRRVVVTEFLFSGPWQVIKCVCVVTFAFWTEHIEKEATWQLLNKLEHQILLPDLQNIAYTVCGLIKRKHRVLIELIYE